MFRVNIIVGFEKISHIVLGVSNFYFEQVNNDLKVALNVFKVKNKDRGMIPANI